MLEQLGFLSLKEGAEFCAFISGFVLIESIRKNLEYKRLENKHTVLVLVASELTPVF
jgi:hypothetical protein